MKTSLILGAALLTAAINPNLTGRAEPASPSKSAPSETRSGESKTDAPARKATHSVPFRGKVAAVDGQQMTFTLSGPKQRVFHLTSETKIEKDGKPAAFADIALGDEARGLYQNGDESELVVIKASFGPKADQPAKESKASAKAAREEAGS